MPARSSTVAATRPLRPTFALNRARSAAPRSRRARRPASTRPSSCATAVSAFGGKGVLRAVAHVNGEIADAVRGRDAGDRRGSTAPSSSSTGPRTSPGSAPTRSSGCRSRSPAPRRRAGAPLCRYLGGEHANLLPVPMMNVLNGGAHADNPVDFQEFMIVPLGRRHVRARRCAWAPRSTTAQGLLRRAGSRRGSATRAASRPDLDTNEGRSSCWSRRSRRPATARRGHRARAGPGRERVLQRRPVPPRAARAARCTSAEMVDYWAAARRPLPDRLDRGRAWPRTTGTAGAR